MRRLLPFAIALVSFAQTTVAEAAAPPGYRVVEESRSELVIAGSVFIGLSVVSLGYGVHKLNNPDRPKRMVDGGGDSFGGTDQSSGAVVPLGLSALFGAIGIPLVVYGATSKRQVLIPVADARVSVVPGGLALCGRF